MESTSNTFSTFLSDLKDVKTSVYLQGSPIVFNTLILRQELNSCHSFEFTQDFLGKEDLISRVPPQSLTNYVGERIHILFEHASNRYEFVGFITEVVSNVWETARDKPNVNSLCYKGKGAVCLLDGAASMHSFTDSTLLDIVENLTNDYSQHFATHCVPKFEGILPFAMQYKESVFGFLNRLSSIYNELFFYDGKTLVFGEPPSGNQQKLTFDEDIISFRTSTQTVAHRFSHYDYFAEQDTYLLSQEATIPKRQNTIFTPLLERHKGLYSDNSMHISPAATSTSGELDSVLQGHCVGTLGRMHIIEGKTKTSRVKIGGLIRVHFSEHYNLGREIGVYRVIFLEHQVARDGGYVNHFMAVPEGLEFCLFTPQTVAYPEVARVVDNDDPDGRGRVRVQFYWQEQKGLKTNWLRVQSIDGGLLSDSSCNRGVVFIPELGDQVMVSFEQGDPHRPYVSGSMFHGKNASGVSNNVRSITTKSGSTITFDDTKDAEKITIKDRDGSVITFDTEQKSLLVQSVETMEFSAKNIKLNAEENVEITTQKDVFINSKSKTVLNSESDMELLSKTSVRLQSEEEMTLKSNDTLRVEAQNKATLRADTTIVEGKTQAEFNGAQTKVTGKSLAEITANIVKIN
ncbi:phage baseplate assembly protein V [Capnocytophaga felis]|uniref:Gp5/Type VI secretion system Vgr protein OB-fold domain-containing protein n=1 Tax=Capnocytophaga felis TaxID=2267611 RepID=A0A5M4BC61_9FLAO|nr:phage baseplate assembly protein V [Capnocytophaga felis]GET47153.1 hypothetical protein RCZ01_24550 [Capnocytophaga felis]GET49629.1 hypothetical protein RCZ02_24600 [Capnocytophaga felis]